MHLSRSSLVPPVSSQSPVGTEHAKIDSGSLPIAGGNKAFERLQRAAEAADNISNQALVHEDARDMNRAKKQIETSVGEKMQSSNAQVTEWGFPGTRGLATGGSQSSLPEHGKTHAMSHSSGSSVSHDSGGSLFEREETRHQHRLQFLERMVLTDTNCVC